jgi:hypothetical protein
MLQSQTLCPTFAQPPFLLEILQPVIAGSAGATYNLQVLCRQHTASSLSYSQVSYP